MKTDNIKQCVTSYKQLEENGHAESFKNSKEAEKELNELIRLAEIGAAVEFHQNTLKGDYGKINFLSYEEVDHDECEEEVGNISFDSIESMVKWHKNEVK